MSHDKAKKWRRRAKKAAKLAETLSGRLTIQASIAKLQSRQDANDRERRAKEVETAKQAEHEARAEVERLKARIEGDGQFYARKAALLQHQVAEALAKARSVEAGHQVQLKGARYRYERSEALRAAFDTAIHEAIASILRGRASRLTADDVARLAGEIRGKAWDKALRKVDADETSEERRGREIPSEETAQTEAADSPRSD